MQGCYTILKYLEELKMSTKPLEKENVDRNDATTFKPIKASIPVEVENKINPVLKHVAQMDGKDF